MKEKILWYNLSMEEAIELGAEEYEQKNKKEELKRISVHLPQILRMGVASVQDNYDLSQRYILYRVIQHGFSILQKRYSGNIKEIETARKALRFPKVQDIRNFMYEITTTIDGGNLPGTKERIKRREVYLNPNIVSALSKTGETIGIERASLIRVCMYQSFATSKNVHSELQKIANKELAVFDLHMRRRKVMYKGFVVIEELWDEDIQRKDFIEGKQGENE
jgi:hypothetical protein